MSIYSLFRLIVCTTMLMTMAVIVQAGEDGTGEWQYTAIPYMWAISAKGNSKIGNAPEADLDITFGEVLENLNFGLMGRFEATHNKWKIYGSGLFALLSGDKDAPGVGIDVDIDTAIAEVGAQYHVRCGPPSG